MSKIRERPPAGTGLEQLRAVIAQQLAARGHRYDLADYQRVVACPHLGRRIAVAYMRAPVISSGAVGAYTALRTETSRQFRLLTDPPERGGLGFIVRLTTDDPYDQADTLLADLDRGQLRIWLTASCGNHHPLLSDEDNDHFRAVHYAFGHGGSGRGFDIHGEEAAWLLHHRMYSARAQPALTTETRGQSNALVFGQPPGIFRRQKAVLLPPRYNDEATVHRAPCGGGCPH